MWVQWQRGQTRTRSLRWRLLPERVTEGELSRGEGSRAGQVQETRDATGSSLIAQSLSQRHRQKLNRFVCPCLRSDTISFPM